MLLWLPCMRHLITFPIVNLAREDTASPEMQSTSYQMLWSVSSSDPREVCSRPNMGLLQQYIAGALHVESYVALLMSLWPISSSSMWFASIYSLRPTVNSICDPSSFYCPASHLYTPHSLVFSQEILSLRILLNQPMQLKLAPIYSAFVLPQPMWAENTTVTWAGTKK